MILSKAQELALKKLFNDRWKTAYLLKVRVNTLFALERKGLIERKRGEHVWPGWERTSISWRKKRVST